MPKSYSKQFSLYDSGLVPSSVEQLPTASASVAFTVDSGKVFREDGEIVPVTLSNGIQYMPWGGDNPLPYHVLARYRGQVSVLRKSLVSPVAWEKWVGHWPVPCPVSPVPYFLGKRGLHCFVFANNMPFFTLLRKNQVNLFGVSSFFLNFAE